jgi:cellulose synthase/poly-beta-1,6-N-acetylglucosamine synthase-like glycosyltransferase
VIELLLPYIHHFINFLDSLGWLFISYFFIVNLVYLILVFISLFYIKKLQGYYSVFEPEGAMQSDLYKSITVIAPAYNEEVNIIDSVETLMQVQYRDFEVIVVNDGSSDETLQRLADQFNLFEDEAETFSNLPHMPVRKVYRSTRYDNLIVIDKENGGKADALNAGINHSSKELFCSIDADSILEPDALRKMLRAFVEDDKLIAAGGIVRIANGCKIEGYEVKKVDIPRRFLPRLQTVEYLRSFLFGRVGWDYFNSLLIISGAFGIFDRKAVIRAGGYMTDSVGEDMELVVRLHRYFREQKEEYRIRYVPEPVCWTEVPERWTDLASQRNRWQRGLADSLWRHRTMFLNRKYGRLGNVTMPYFFLIEFMGPVIEMMGYFYFLFVILFFGIYEPFVLLFLSVAILMGILLSISSLISEEATFRRYGSVKNIFILTLYAILENLGYRQINTWWRFKGVLDYIRGKKGWGKIQRFGFSRSAADVKKTSRATQDFKLKLRTAYYWALVTIIPPFALILLFNLLFRYG